MKNETKQNLDEISDESVEINSETMDEHQNENDIIVDLKSVQRVNNYKSKINDNCELFSHDLILPNKSGNFKRILLLQNGDKIRSFDPFRSIKSYDIDELKD